MQEALGLWHDYVVLTERAMQISLEELLPHHDADMQARCARSGCVAAPAFIATSEPVLDPLGARAAAKSPGRFAKPSR